MLLLSLTLLIALGRLDSFLPTSLAVRIEPFVGAVGISEGFIALFAALFGLTFFLASAAKKNPQVQFLVECFVGLAYLLFMPTY